MMESSKKSIYKTISWQLVHVSFVAGILYLFTKEWEYVGLGALGYMAWESSAYYIHERIWAKFGNRLK